jgi:hypothetical protein
MNIVFNKNNIKTLCMILLLQIVFFNTILHAQGNKTFNKPTIKGYRLDWCLHWATQCGKPAADAWCVTKMGKAGGYAMDWKISEDIGASTPTYVIGDKTICNQSFCDGFRWIKCGYSID